MGIEEMGLLDKIESDIIEVELNHFAKNLKERNHYFTIYCFDLSAILSFRPSLTVWSKLVRNGLSEDTESWLFEELINYVLNTKVEIKFTTMVSSLVNAIRNRLRIEYGCEVEELTDELLLEMTKYITALAGALNKVTNNILDHSVDMSSYILSNDDISCSSYKFIDANEYFEVEEHPLHYIHTVTTRVRRGKFRGLLIIWTLRKKL